jgi:ComF family protein
LGIYEWALLSTVIGLKSSPHIPARVRKLAEERVVRFEAPDVIVPVPLSKKRFIERGFNQAQEIAHLAGRTFKAQVVTDVLIRHTHTPMHRAGMDRKARELTVKNAFKIADGQNITGKSVLLVDDVMTSGSTVSHCAKALKKNGARAVTVFTIARAV